MTFSVLPPWRRFRTTPGPAWVRLAAGETQYPTQFPSSAEVYPRTRHPRRWVVEHEGEVAEVFLDVSLFTDETPDEREAYRLGLIPPTVVE